MASGRFSVGSSFTNPIDDQSHGTVLAVASAKGGVGKTTTAINLGSALADHHSVVVVELDLAMANIVDFLELPLDGGATIHEVLSGSAQLTDAIYPAPGGMDVVPSGTDIDGYVSTDPTAIGAVVSSLSTRYDIVLLDTGAGVSQESLLPLALADGVVLVSTPRVASVRDTLKTSKLTERLGGQVSGIVFVKSGSGGAPPVERIAKFFEVELLGHIPEDPTVPSAQDAGLPVVVARAESPAATAYTDAANRLRRVIKEVR